MNCVVVSLLLLYVLLQLINVLSFNLDTENPIIYQDPYNTMNLENGNNSYFGYSVILYSGDNQTKPWVQIGAPRGNYKFSWYNPGTVFKCEIWKICKTVIIDADAYNNIGTSKARYNNISYESKMDQAWIGSVMDINTQFNRIIVCAYRWTYSKHKRNSRFCVGACYWSTINETKYEILIPLIDDKHYFIYYTKEDRTPMFAFAEAGFSAHFTNSRKSPELLLGAPSANNWRGSSLIYKNLYKSNSTDQSISSLNIANTDDTFENNDHSQLYGYAVTSGYYFNEKELLYVTSAPKQNTTGAIYVYKFHARSNEELDVKELITGTQLGEYFGASLASGDIDMDGFDDLIVGAPLHKIFMYNEGKVYIYYGSPEGTFQKRKITYLTGESTGGQFGLTVAYIGDIDMDGYGDIAVAAPYENDNSGVVYIYSSSNGIFAESQRIVGKDIDMNLKGFGYSFSKPADIDNNNYKDLAIGAYLSGHTVILRSRPVVILKQSIRFLDPRICLGMTKTIVEICLRYEGKLLPSEISVVRYIVVDEGKQRATLDLQHKSIMEVKLKDRNPLCQNYTIYIQKKIKDSIVVRVYQKLKNKKPGKAFYVGSDDEKFSETMPIARSFQDTKEEIHFFSDCSEMHSCKSNLSFDVSFSNLNDNNIYLLGSAKTLELNIDVTNMGENAYSTKIFVTLPKDVEFRAQSTFVPVNSSTVQSRVGIMEFNTTKTISLELEMTKVNEGESTDDLVFKVTLQTNCQDANKNSIIKYFNLILYSDANVTLTGLSTNETIYENLNEDRLIAFSQTYQMKKLGISQVNEIKLYLHIPTSITINNNIIPFLGLKQPIKYGKTTKCRNLTDVNYIDSNTKDNNKSVKYMDKKIDDEDDVEITDGSEVDQEPVQNNEDLHQYFTILSSNNQSETAHINDSNFMSWVMRTKLDVFKNNTYVINCDIEGITCVTIECDAGPFTSQQNIALVRINALLNITYFKDLLKNNTLHFQTMGNSNYEKDKTKSREAVVTSIFSMLPGELKIIGMQLWIVVVAVISAIILFAFIITGLIKVGFFKREDKIKLKAMKFAEELAFFESNARLSGDCDALHEKGEDPSFSETVLRVK